MMLRYAVALLFASLSATRAIGAPSGAVAAIFATPEAAAAALVDAVRSGKPASIEQVLGPGSTKLVESGDATADAAERQQFLSAYDEHHEFAAEPDRTIIRIGRDNWPLPIPLVQSGGGWHFDAQAAAEELIDRRIGRNEIAAIETALAFVDAQKAFYAFTGDGGHAEYAMRFISSPGKQDGLYWPTGGGEPESPLAPLIEQAKDEGYPTDPASGAPRPYRGYLFRILTAQGPDTPGGAISYVSEGHMTKGFALIAWPASYGASGVMSFIVNQDSSLFQKDLGPNTAALVPAIKMFDPDLTWTRVELVN